MGADHEADELLKEDEDFKYTRPARSTSGVIVPWILAGFFFCTTILSLLFSTIHVFPSRDSRNYENGFATDFVAESPNLPIKMIQKTFTNDLLFNITSQELYNQPLDPNEVTYIGPPSPAIDAAWKNLLHAQYIALSTSETAQIPAAHRAPIFYNGEHNFMELSVFHNLHCLNELRLTLDHGHEKSEDWMHEGRAHLDHCVDQIRQALMCHADLTPVPMMPVVGGPERSILGNGEVHTCRDFDAIWAWVEERGKERKAFGD
ncbi:hypothetical protein VTL71DRAFT_9676 [Oculimacula yallundae]|uniref:Uncharacterized protein n=1 Tax=Oculimacula yallundae TaxID=86028 RepID=A0ABR4BRI9_9HELO